jgi:hypothetical protein
MTRSAAAAASQRAAMGIIYAWYFDDAGRCAQHDDAACLPRPSNIDFV